jgi:hypothetical protein
MLLVSLFVLRIVPKARKAPSGITLGVIDDYPEWKHKVLKLVARLLFLKSTNYVILVHTIKTEDEDGRKSRA